MRKFTHLLFTIIFFGTQVAFSQVGAWQFNNFSGIQGNYLNPAALSDSRIGWQVQFGSIYTRAGLKDIDSPSDYVLFSGTSLKLNKQSWSPVFTDARGPGFMLQLPNRHAFSISTRYRSASLKTGSFSSDVAANVNGIWTSEAFNEIAISYAVPILAFKNHHLRVGGTYKILGAVQLDELQAAGGYSTSTNRFSGTVSSISSTFNQPFSFAKIIPTQSNGGAFDVGIIYDFIPNIETFSYPMDGKERYDVTKNKYLVRFGISILDNGSLTYNNLQVRRSVFSNKVVPNSFLKENQTKDLRELLISEPSQARGTRLRKLPSSLVINADVRLGKNGWYVNALLNTLKGDVGFAYNPQLVAAITPRFEKDGAEFSVPLSYLRQSKQYAVGLHIKLGGLFFGTESLNALFGSNRPAPTVYAGFSIQGRAKKIKDKDGDAVSDRHDKCPDLAGLWTFKGCPDRDGDGIKDADDQCPEHPGPKETNGCPDSDGDGIFDKNDARPNAAGPQKFNGCPDTDNDGIPDSEDACPQKAGLAEFGGCPDTDGDGLMDNEDDCPDMKGSKLLRGCPDTDGDGIIDKNDLCPDQKGTSENNGCPDADGDGVIDKNDECPEEIGWKSLDGCLPKAFFKTDTLLSADLNATLKKLSTQLLLQSVNEMPVLDSLQSRLNQHPNEMVEVVFVGRKAEKLKTELMPFVQKTLESVRYEAKIEPQLSTTASGLLLRIVTKP